MRDRYADLCKRLEAKRYVREGRDERDYVCDLECDAEDYGARPINRNPDGPEAAATIKALIAELKMTQGLLSQTRGFLSVDPGGTAVLDRINAFLARNGKGER